MYKHWICFFSQTGGEINSIRKILKRDPDLIVTNRTNLDGLSEELRDRLPWFQFLPDRPSIQDYDRLIERNKILFENCLITLHGYLRIIPESLCNNYSIINLHPGYITKYPELKGFNPQKKAFNLHLPTSGVVIHKVVPAVDSGEIITSKEVDIEGLSLDDIYAKLHDVATDTWVSYLRTILK